MTIVTTFPFCAGCGAEITDQGMVEPSLCPVCEEKIQQADTAWIKKEEKIKGPK